MDSDIRQIIAAARDLVYRCEQGRTAWLRQLAQPLPPMLREDAKHALYEIHELTRFDPFDGLRQRLPFTDAEQDPRRREAHHRHSENTRPARGDSLRSLVPFDPRKPAAARTGRGESAAAATSESVGPAATGQQKSRARQQATAAHADAGAAVIDATALRQIAERIASSAHRKEVSKDSSGDARTTTGLPDKGRASAANKPVRPHAAGEIIAGKRKQRAEARHLAATRPAAVQQRPGEKAPHSINSASPAAHASPALPDTRPGRGSALLAEAIAGLRRHAPTIENTTAAAPTSGKLSGQAGNSSTGRVQSTRTGGPVRVEEIDAEVVAPATAPRAPTAAPSPPAEDLARLLADAAYLHGIDLT